MYYKRNGLPYTGPNATEEFSRDFADTSIQKVRQKVLENGIFVSTVWLGSDYSRGESNQPLIFETVVFAANRKPIERLFYTNEEEAMEGHLDLVKKYQSYSLGQARYVVLYTPQVNLSYGY